MALKSDAKFKEKLTCGLENEKEFGKFSPEHSKVSELDFDLLSKVENVWAKIYWGVMCYGNEEWYKISIRNWLVVSKFQKIALWWTTFDQSIKFLS